MSTLQFADVILHTTDRREIHLHRITTPSPEQQRLLDQLGIRLPERHGFDQESSADPAAA